MLTLNGTVCLFATTICDAVSGALVALSVLTVSSSIVLTTSSEVASMLPVMLMTVVLYPWLLIQEVMSSSTCRL